MNENDGGNVLPAPLDWVESIAELQLPQVIDDRMQILMGRNNEGLLRGEERVELESLVELSEMMSVVRARALHLLRRG